MKKERYFSPESIEAKSRDMLQDIEELRKRHPLKLSPQRSALLVLDMQRYFLNEDSHAFVPSAPAIIPGIAKLIGAYSQKGLPIVFTRHTNTEANAGMMSIWWRDLIDAESPSSEIIPELDSSQGIVLEKNQYDAFYGTNLEEMLREKQISQVVICGVMTHLCCETTARAAFVRGFEVFLAIDGTATYSEPFHRATLWNSAHGFAVPMLIDEMIKSLE
ncbi:MAG: isochorismatase family protein [Dehalococcoidia bacterium]